MSTLARIQDSGVILLGNRPSCLLLSSQDFDALINAISSSFSTSYLSPLCPFADLISFVSSKIDLIKSSIKSSRMNKEISLSKKIRKEIKKDVHDEVKKNQKSSHQVSFRKGATRQR